VLYVCNELTAAFDATHLRAIADGDDALHLIPLAGYSWLPGCTR
jgi:hypothetical protein